MREHYSHVLAFWTRYHPHASAVFQQERSVPTFVSSGFFIVTHPKFSLSSTYKEEITDCVLDNENSCAGAADFSQKKQTPSGRKEVRHMDKELWKAITQWLEIANETNERLAQVRRELAEIRLREELKQNLLKVQLY
jgi:hypothetical protein